MKINKPVMPVIPKAKKKKVVKAKPTKKYPFTTIKPRKRHGHPWHRSEARWVTKAYSEGMSVEEISKICDRTDRAIEYFLATGDNFASTEISVMVRR